MDFKANRKRKAETEGLENSPTILQRTEPQSPMLYAIQLQQSIGKLARGIPTLPTSPLYNTARFFDQIVRLKMRFEMLAQALEDVSSFYLRFNWKNITDTKEIISLRDSNVIIFQGVLVKVIHLCGCARRYVREGESNEDVKSGEAIVEETMTDKFRQDLISTMQKCAKLLAFLGNVTSQPFNGNTEKTAAFIDQGNAIIDTIVADLLRFSTLVDSFVGYNAHLIEQQIEQQKKRIHDLERSLMQPKDNREEKQGKNQGNA
ncbi:hypothetical protein F5Y18DRAFT_255858 [Xylariaceae sp. FL1019]|nr:hypothetical protein F5Y18DRAFT_255858 [Xylariaceae sp. FL1019]